MNITAEGLKREINVYFLSFIDEARTNDVGKLAKLWRSKGRSLHGDPIERMRRLLAIYSKEGFIRDDGKRYLLTRKGRQEMAKYKATVERG